MLTALAGAASCLVCGSPTPPDPDDRAGSDPSACPRCGVGWPPAATADPSEPGWLSDVRAAGTGTRLLAVLVDLVVPVALVAWAVLLLRDGRSVGVLVAVVAAVLLLAQLGLLLGRGRTPGRRLLGLRTVDDLTGAPIGVRRWWSGLVDPAARPRARTVDVRHGRDPARTRPPGPGAGLGTRPGAGATDAASLTVTPSDTEPLTGRAAAEQTGTSPVPARRAAVGVRTTSNTTEAGAGDPSSDPSATDQATGSGSVGRSVDAGSPAVAVVLENGERHVVQRVLFVGRNPVDPSPAPGRTVLALPDLSRRVAKTHLMLEWTGTVLWVTDLESAGGTSIVLPDGSRMPLAPGARFAVGIGSVLSVGGRTLRVVPGA